MHFGLREVADRRVLFLDMNSFFASVEQQWRPELREKPVAVVSHAVPNGTVLAASYEAKAFGVRTGMKVREARLLCAGLALVEPDHIRYRSAHARFMAILRDVCGPEAEPYSIDEAAAVLPPNWRDPETARALALRVKERFRNELGPCIRCSIGIAPNTFLGKVASNLQKPDGLVEITLSNLEEKLAGMELEDLPGIARRMAAAFALHGIPTPLELYRTPAAELRAWMGIAGQYWWWRLHGYEPETDRLKPHKTLSHEHVLKQWLYDKQSLRPIALKMADRLVSRLRRNGYRCRTLWLSVRVSGAPGLFGERSFDVPSGGYLELMGSVRTLLDSFPEPLGPVRKVTLGLGSLTSAASGEQMDLFLERPRDERVSGAVELVRKRHGSDAVKLGSVLSVADKVAKEQLGFGQIKDPAPRYG